MLQIIMADGVRETQRLAEMRARASEQSAAITQAAEKILAEVREQGERAVRRYSEQLDHAAPREITQDELCDAYRRCDPAVRAALLQAAENITAYHENMLAKSWEFAPQPGCRLGQRVRGLARVGIYVPGGTAAYPSSVLMNAIPARVAGVGELIMVTPPTENLNTAVLAAAKIAGIDRVFAVGGVQAIGALSYGAGEIPRVDKIVGPGNAYVAAAKRLVYGTVDIDMVAGPSEILILADESAPAAYVAADLLSQAEHDKLASAIVVTTDEALAHAVCEQVEQQIKARARAEIIRASLRDYGAIIVVPDTIAACRIANEIAPEHLEIMTKNPRADMEQIQNAGAIFLGNYSPEPLGDYMAGPCHVLPTSGTARFFSPLSTDSFLKKSSVIEYSAPALQALSDQIETLARAEGLDAHANSIEVRRS